VEEHDQRSGTEGDVLQVFSNALDRRMQQAAVFACARMWQVLFSRRISAGKSAMLLEPHNCLLRPGAREAAHALVCFCDRDY